MYDLVVLGGGPGGLGVASSAARVGAKVALIEKPQVTGAPTGHASTSSKALIEAARLAHTVRHAGRFGLAIDAVRVDFAAVMARVREVATNASSEPLRSTGIDVLHGCPAFESYDTVVLDGVTRVSGRRFVIATGSRPDHPKVRGLNEAGFLDSSTVWGLDSLPESLVVLGSGPIGLEFAQAFARLGSKVTVVCESERVLPTEDEEVSRLVQTALEADQITFHLGTELTVVEVRDGRKVVKGVRKSGGAAVEAIGSEILVAAGRLANVEGLNLEVIGVHADPEHGIEVDDYLQTRSPHVYAIGDVLGHDRWSHAARREAAIAFQNAVLRLPKKMDYSAVPRAAFLDPEVASVGLTEAEAKAQSTDVVVLHADYADLDRARIDGAVTGFAKVVASPSGRILGASVVGRDAAIVLQEIASAMQQGVGLSTLAETIHVGPTYADIVRQVAEQFAARRAEGGMIRSALRWFLGYGAKEGASNGAETTASVAEEVGHGH